MKYRFHAMSCSARRFRIGDIANDQLYPAGQIVRPAGGAIVKHAHPRAFGDKPSHQVRPDKARSAGNEDSHAQLRWSSAR
jgi:hypothetical protein